MRFFFFFYHLSLFFFPFFFWGSLYKVVTTMIRRAVKENFNCKHRAVIYLWLFTSNVWEITFPYFLKKNERTFQLFNRSSLLFLHFLQKPRSNGRLLSTSIYKPIEYYVPSFTKQRSNHGWLLSPDILPLNILSIPLFVINTIARSSFGCCNCISINAKTVMFYQTPVTTRNCYKQMNRGNLTEELFYCLNWLFNALISATRLITRRL